MNKEDTTLQERVLSMINYYGQGKNTRFSDLTGVGEASLRGYLKGILPKADFFEKVARYCEGISMEWLITGQGNMLKSDEATPHQYDGTGEMLVSDLPEQYNKVSQDNMVDKLIGIIDKKDDIIRQQAEDIGHLRSELEQLKKNFKQVLAPAQILTNEG